MASQMQIQFQHSEDPNQSLHVQNWKAPFNVVGGASMFCYHPPSKEVPVILCFLLLAIISERQPHDLDDGCEGDDDFDDDVGDVDGDIDDVDYSNDAFSNAIDVFSLSEAIDIMEKKA
ncbi:unnamed protein product [Prunus armeniaca]|uniref:Uncharacterized protein n=1 Tax=Prunus armeniaca TaxID=36596 RepID=A0A6J5XW37_PRUAR|nr:unnamed protein product [Prunus armeniaca]CAB4315224.1 unnamed protein product [Prunus armeniaca]